jgi:hypothetical protein
MCYIETYLFHIFSFTLQGRGTPLKDIPNGIVFHLFFPLWSMNSLLLLSVSIMHLGMNSLLLLFVSIMHLMPLILVFASSKQLITL